MNIALAVKFNFRFNRISQFNPYEMIDNNEEMIKNYQNYALIKSDGPLEYAITNTKDRSYVILENHFDAQFVIKEFLKSGVEVFESYYEYNNKYPPFSIEEIKARGMIFWWEKIPKADWPKDVKKYFEQDPYWSKFKILL